MERDGVEAGGGGVFFRDVVDADHSRRWKPTSSTQSSTSIPGQHNSHAEDTGEEWRGGQRRSGLLQDPTPPALAPAEATTGGERWSAMEAERWMNQENTSSVDQNSTKLGHHEGYHCNCTFPLGVLGLISHSVICSTLGNETDRLSLLEFKNSITLNPHQSLISWNDSTHFCSWEGISCSSKNPPRVTAIDLRSQGLVGHISPSLGNLTFLRNLSLATNGFTGQIPESLGHLRRLRSLYLSNNTLQGIIPSFANCSQLTVLWLDHNDLAGGFPDGLPLGLQELQLSSNRLVGTIPPSLSNITALRKLSFAFNSITGSIPGELGTLSGVEILYASSNRLLGGFPEAILNMSALVALSLSTNSFSAELPSGIGSSLPNLRQLAIGINFFHGDIPSSLANASNLVKIDISENNFTGVVPASIGKLANLTRLNLEMNQLHARSKQDWEFMDSVANCTQLQGISIARNQMEGENQLSGSFPSGIANLPNLIILGLDYNRFSGSVPQWLGGLKKLQKLSLSTNSFTGYLPSSLSNLSHLTEILLDTNQFIGNIPSSFGNLQFLTTITITDNNLHGGVPKEIFRIPTIAEVGLSSNNLSGDIPNTLSNCENLQHVELDQNNFSGGIPTSFGKLISLKFLNLSHNKLSGSIPVSLGDLQLLEQIDLSFNHLTGQVPTKGIFKNSTSMQIDGNLTLCGGALELHLPECPFTPSNTTKGKLPVLLKVVIPLASMVTLAIVILVLYLIWKGKQRTNSISLPSFGREFPKVSYKDLARATNGFSTSNLIGEGRYGSVYQGQLFQDINVVAIKVFSLETKGAQKSFIAECNALRNVQHRNLVPVLTACSSIDSSGNDFKALVYEFMPRGDLHKLLYSTPHDETSSDLCYISLAQRLSIVVNVSNALAYLHHNHQGTIIHCDIKPTNILLDDNMTAHVGDFGLARFKNDSRQSFGNSHLPSSFAINGTVGYVAPECAGGGQISTAADVYSFGVVLLEIFIRRRPTDDMFKDGLSIAKFTEMNIPDKMLQIVDPRLVQELSLCKEDSVINDENGAQCPQASASACRRRPTSYTQSGIHISEDTEAVQDESVHVSLALKVGGLAGPGLINIRQNLIAMKITAVGQLILVLMACSSHAVICSTFGNGTDQLSLLEFKKAISLDPQQSLMYWNDSTNYCSWEGVSCSLKNPGRVTSLNLTNRALVGHISPSLGNLTFLKYLALPKNALSGEIPPSLGHLRRLQYLYLSGNTLQGSIPSFANCSELKVLWVHRNILTGKFPADWPPKLQQLQLSINNLTGAIPASLANISSLNVLSCVYNHIEGNIPNEFAKLPNLQTLYVGSNQLSGSFPQVLLNLSTLINLSLGLNHLSGEVPSNLGSALPNLEIFELPVNFFHGRIPSSLTNASNLYFLELSNNNFTGLVPRTIGELNKLQMLNLEWNQLQAHREQDWEFLQSLGNCTELQVFSMTGNRLQGHVPSSLGNLSDQLQELHLAESKLSGIANLQNLIIVALGANQFTGVLPEWLGTIKTLQKVSLGSNLFTGAIPSSFSNLSQLGELYLDSNQLVGQLPPSFGTLPILQVLIVSNNNLHGSIPKEIFRIPTIVQINLSFNNLDAPLHNDIGKAKQLTYLQLSSNNISGYIPSTLGDCESLEDIELDHNVFSGSIPASLENIKTLKVLNLSYNNLSGSIPASLGNLQLVEQLDLSFNNLKGEVPTKGIFKNTTAIRVGGNPGLCGGSLELHLLTCSSTPLNSVKHKQFIFLKVVLPIAIMTSLVIAISIMWFWNRKQNRQSISSPSFGRKFPKVSYSDLVRATEGFSASNLIGRGRYGSVYQGKLFPERNLVAVKVFNLETRGAGKSFIAECNALKNVRHRNLITILTACSSIDSSGNDFKALVYEFMPRGDLHNLLYSTRDGDGSSNLYYVSLAQRLNIVVDVSDALAYLHHNHQGSIVHSDLKPSNILLDDNMTAHVGDFGLAAFKSDSAASSFGDSSLTSSFAIKGTIGYVAPECAGGGRVSTASDIYSFGIVLLEIFIRRKPTDDMFKDGLSISKYTEINFPDKMLQIVDPQLLRELDICQETSINVEKNEVCCLLSVLNIGLHCTKLVPGERMSMQEV
uniref:Receptor kinase-like protein Xa21 n=1 Tax=Oryza nivara TaxID=4536 RepID=A0A0E0HGM8_ORYNI